MTVQQFLATFWHWNPALTALCGVALAVHVWAFGVSPKTGLLAIAIAVVLVAFQSPIDVLADGYLFSAHMLQHLLMVLIVPPLILLSIPQQAAGPFLRRPVPALAGWALGTGAMWLWHIPALCDAAVESEAIRVLQAASLLVMGAAFWQPVLGPGKRISPPAGMIYLFTACIACTLLGIAITFSPVAVCPAYSHPVDRLGIISLIQAGSGLTPDRDQQIGGLLMWLPPCLVYLGGILALLMRWLHQPDAVSSTGTALASNDRR